MKIFIFVVHNFSLNKWFQFNIVSPGLRQFTATVYCYSIFQGTILGANLTFIFFSINSRHSAAVDYSGNFVSVLLGELSMASGPNRVQGLLHGPPSVLCHHKLGYRDLHHWALCSHLSYHVVCLQPEGWVFAQKNCFLIIVFYTHCSSDSYLAFHKTFWTRSNKWNLLPSLFPTEVSVALPYFSMDHFSGLSNTLCSGLWPDSCLHPGLQGRHTRRCLPCLHNVWDDRAWSCTHLQRSFTPESGILLSGEISADGQTVFYPH